MSDSCVCLFVRVLFQVKVWTFHSTQNVLTGDYGRTAERIAGTSGFAVSATPMKVNMLYEVVCVCVCVFVCLYFAVDL